MHSLYLKPKEHRRLVSGHLWVFSNELREVPRDIAAGETVQLFTHDGRLLGAGFFNPQSLIAFRLLTRGEEQPDRDFFRRKLLEALKLREKIYPESETNAWRLVHGESDGLPGLVIDRFDRAFVLQSFSAGIDQHLPLFCELLRELFDPKAIVVRNESPLRELEGLPLYRETVLGESSDMHQEIRDSGISYRVNILEGQKTGFSSTSAKTGGTSGNTPPARMYLTCIRMMEDSRSTPCMQVQNQPPWSIFPRRRYNAPSRTPERTGSETSRSWLQMHLRLLDSSGMKTTLSIW